ncbi:MAG: peptidoglycan-binding protein [Patescibacteria group bacterium]|nr:peptidoglycan-binding protein [Patescibacteria group bacterium]
MVKKTLSLLAVALLLAMPLSSSAAGLTTMQMQAITSLLASFGVDSTTIANVQATLSGAAAPTPSTSTGSASSSSGSTTSSAGTTTSGIGSHISQCIVLNRTLSLGASGSDVSDLQQFLSDNGFYAGPVTGYFGDLTEKAIEALQSQHDIVATGTPRTTGFGALGPMTRDFLAGWCTDHAGAGSSSSANTSGGGDVVSSNVMTKIGINELGRVASGAVGTISGVAENVTTISVSVTEGTTTAYQNSAVPVSNGTWSVTLPVLPDGVYAVLANAGGNRAVSIATLVVGMASSSVVSSSGTEVPTQTVPPSGSDTSGGTSSESSNSSSSSSTSAGTSETVAPASISIRLNGSTGVVTIPSGGSVSVGWTAENASGCTIASQPASNLSGAIPTNAWAQLSGPLTANTVFTITCTGENGASVSKSATVNVTASTPTSSTGSGFTGVGSGGLVHIACPEIAYQCPNGQWVSPSGPSCTYACTSSSI